ENAMVPGARAGVDGTGGGVGVLTAVVDEQPYSVMGTGRDAVAGCAMDVVTGQVQLEADAEEVAAGLREVGAVVTIVAGQIDHHPHTAGQCVSVTLVGAGINPPAQAHPQPEAVVLKAWVAGLGVRAVRLVVAAGVLLAALVGVVAGHV